MTSPLRCFFIHLIWYNNLNEIFMQFFIKNLTAIFNSYEKCLILKKRTRNYFYDNTSYTGIFSSEI